MKRIIVPVDFSSTSENAADFAMKLAAFYHADVYLYHAYRVYSPLSEASPLVSTDELQDAADYELKAFKKKLAAKINTPVNVYIRAENNWLQNGLPQYCKEIKPDMVVMGLSGKNALTRLVVGSNTIYAIQHLPYPVLVIPPNASFVPVRKLGFACDYKQVIETTPVGTIKKLLQDFNAELEILNVETGEPGHEEKVEQSAYVAEFFESAKPHYHSVFTHDITGGINLFAEKTKADWLVVIPKKHNLIEKLFKRSQTSSLLNHTSVPVLCIHEE